AVGACLHGVPHRRAPTPRTLAARRRARESPLAAAPHPAAPPAPDCGDLGPVLDRELSRLPERYRLPVVLCDLEGRTRREVARQLGLPDGTLSNRLSKGRELLCRRLKGCGFAVPAAALAALLTPAAAEAANVPPPGGPCSSEVIALCEGVSRDMFLPKLKIATAAVLVLAVLGAAAGLTWQARAARPDAGKEAQDDPEPKADAERAAKADLKKLQGTWYIVGGSYLGMQAPERDVEALLKRDNEWVRRGISGDRVVEECATDARVWKGTVKLDATRKPPVMEMTMDPGDGKVETWRYIYKVEGDRLTVCSDSPDLPTKFETAADGKDRKLYVWKRRDK